MKISSIAALLALALVACAGNASNDETNTSIGEVNVTAPLTLANWISHPKIVAVRNEVEATNKAGYKSESKTLCKDSGIGESERTKLTDPSGKIRELVLAGGSEDSAATTHYYYDANGKLRFVFTTVNDVHGNQTEYRTYFDSAGEQFWSVTRHAFDPSFHADITKAPFEINDEDDGDGILDVNHPAALFDAPESCEP